MRKASVLRSGAAALASVAALFAATASAQSTPANPLDVVPEKMPFDIPYGAPIPVDQANGLIAAAAAEAKKRDWKVNIAVVDPGGHLIAFERMDGAQTASIEVAQHKARAAVGFRRDTRVFENGVQNGMVYMLTLDGMIASRGGNLLLQGGKIVGAVGVSGGTSSQDEVIAKAAVSAFK